MLIAAPRPFAFLDVPRLFTLVDHELELVEPESRHVGDLLASCRHPLTMELMPVQGKVTREDLESFVKQNPHGHTAAEPGKDIAAGYTFWMRIRPEAVPLSDVMPLPDVPFAGSISLRIGHTLNLDRYLGHIGYHVLPPARGCHYAERATRLLLPLARAHGHDHVWITVNPDNVASRRTCERLGAELVDTIVLPKENALYSQGDRLKCRYRLRL